MSAATETILAWSHLLLLVPLAVLGLHKAWMIFVYWRVRGRVAQTDVTELNEWPRVTVQLPIFNERFVAERLLEAAARIDYPRDRLQIQVLDDSTDDTTEIVRHKLEQLPADLDVQHLHRTDRTGYKAGALEAGLGSASGEFLAVFDADFLPPIDFLRHTVPQFQDDKVGMVQARWEHLNPDHSTLCSMQALLLDGHFVIEHVARSRSGCFFNFNGTAGVFRRECVADAGGWQHDTLTEDMDLSYRAQLRGWRFVYLPKVACPAELPIDMNAFLTQQHRWAKGSVQTGRKLMGRILRARVPIHARVEAVFHLFGNIAFPLLLAVILVAMPLQLLRVLDGSSVPAFFSTIEGLPLLLASASVLAYYGTAQAILRRLDLLTFLRLPLILALGAGMCVNNTAAFLSALRRSTGEFRRTPKQGSSEQRGSLGLLGYQSPRGILPLLEIGLGLWASVTVFLSFRIGLVASGLFHGLFAMGLFWVGLRSLQANLRRRQQGTDLVPETRTT